MRHVLEFSLPSGERRLYAFELPPHSGYTVRLIDGDGGRETMMRYVIEFQYPNGGRAFYAFNCDTEIAKPTPGLHGGWLKLMNADGGGVIWEGQQR